jgi:hypothetical protein
MVVENARYTVVGIFGFDEIGWHGFTAIKVQKKFLQDISVAFALFQDRRADRAIPWGKVAKKVIQCLSLFVLL